MKRLTPVKAIRKHCLECAVGCKNVRTCHEVSCSFHPYRMGKNPSRKGIGGRKKSKMGTKKA